MNSPGAPRTAIARPLAGADRYPFGGQAALERELAGGRRAGLALGLLTAVVLALAAAPATDRSGQRLLDGAALGTGIGILGTAVSGACIPCGAALGLAVGVGVGHLYDTHERMQRLPVLAWRMPHRPPRY